MKSQASYAKIPGPQLFHFAGIHHRAETAYAADNDSGAACHRF